MPRLSQAAISKLQYVEEVLANTELSEEPDRRLTPFSKNAYGIDSGAIYKLLKARGQPSDDRAKFVWCNVAPPRVQMFVWLLTQGRIQCRKILHRKHVLPHATCEVCNDEDETPEHIIGGCSIGRQFWEKIGFNSMPGMAVDSIHTLSPPSGIPSDEFPTLISLSCWQLWKTRNAAVFRSERHRITQVLAACAAAAEQWRCRFPRKKWHVVNQWCLLFQTARQRCLPNPMTD